MLIQNITQSLKFNGVVIMTEIKRFAAPMTIIATNVINLLTRKFNNRLLDPGDRLRGDSFAKLYA